MGTLEPRKNLPRLFAAYELSRDRLPEPWPLVVAGPDGWGPTLGEALPAGVVLAGRVDAAVLAGLLAWARACAYVPLAEGFGLPVVEAMRAGTPVVSSRVPAAGGATLLVDPLRPEEVAEALVTAAVDEPVRARLVAAGAERAVGLTWAAAAEGHVRIWKGIVGG